MLLIENGLCPKCEEYLPENVRPDFCPWCGIDLQYPEAIERIGAPYVYADFGVMRKGVITCKCGQLFGFETAQEKVACPSCKMEYVAAKYEIVEPEIVEEALEGDE